MRLGTASHKLVKSRKQDWEQKILRRKKKRGKHELIQNKMQEMRAFYELYAFKTDFKKKHKKMCILRV